MYADVLGVKSMAFLLRLMEQGCRQPQRGSYHVKSHIPKYLSNNDLNNHIILLTEEILHQLIDSLTNYLQGSIYAMWCRVLPSTVCLATGSVLWTAVMCRSNLRKNVPRTTYTLATQTSSFFDASQGIAYNVWVPQFVGLDVAYHFMAYDSKHFGRADRRGKISWYFDKQWVSPRILSHNHCLPPRWRVWHVLFGSSWISGWVMLGQMAVGIEWYQQ